MFWSMLSRSGCLRVARVLQSHLDGELDDATSTMVARHLEDSRRCDLEAHTFRAIKAAFTDPGPGAAPVTAEAIARLRRFADDLAEPRL